MAQFLFSIIFLTIIWLFLGLVSFGIMLVVLPIIYYFAVFHKSDKRISAVDLKLANTLMKSETLLAKALQHRQYALLRRRELLAITNSRIVRIKRGLFGGFKMLDIQWKDLRNAQLSENMLPRYFGSNLTFDFNLNYANTNTFNRIAIGGISTELASEIYSEAQSREQEWEEKRRIREMEEKRASSGGVIVNTPFASSEKETDYSIIKEIEKAKQMLDASIISDAEFQEIKSKILSSNYQAK